MHLTSATSIIKITIVFIVQHDQCYWFCNTTTTAAFIFCRMVQRKRHHEFPAISLFSSYGFLLKHNHALLVTRRARNHLWQLDLSAFERTLK